MLRSCYRTKAHLFTSFPRESEIIWYFADNSPFLEFPCAINSLNWVPKDVWPFVGPLGEIPSARRTWRDGSLPGGPPLASAQPWGNPSDFVLGSGLSLAPTPMGPDGLPACCSRCSWSGELVAWPTRVTLAGATSGSAPLADLNGTWPLTHSALSGPCEGFYGNIINPAVLFCGFFAGGVYVQWQIVGGGGLNVIFYALLFAGLPPTGDVVLNLATSVDPIIGTMPPTMTLHMPANCGFDPATVLMTDAGDPLLTDTGDMLFAS